MEGGGGGEGEGMEARSWRVAACGIGLDSPAASPGDIPAAQPRVLAVTMAMTLGSVCHVGWMIRDQVGVGRKGNGRKFLSTASESGIETRINSVAENKEVLRPGSQYWGKRLGKFAPFVEIHLIIIHDFFFL